MLKTRLIGFKTVKKKESRERGNFCDGNNANNDLEEDEPPQAPAPVRMSDEYNNNNDVTPGRFLEENISTS